MTTTRLELRRVHYMPKDLDPGFLYVSAEFDTAAHLCPCGCGEKVVTPIGKGGWTFTDVPAGPTLTPSVYSYQVPCMSHYWITNGAVVWA